MSTDNKPAAPDQELSTICDGCGCELSIDDAQTGRGGSTLCDSCMCDEADEDQS